MRDIEAGADSVATTACAPSSSAATAAFPWLPALPLDSDGSSSLTLPALPPPQPLASSAENTAGSAHATSSRPQSACAGTVELHGHDFPDAAEAHRHVSQGSWSSATGLPPPMLHPAHLSSSPRTRRARQGQACNPATVTLRPLLARQIPCQTARPPSLCWCHPIWRNGRPDLLQLARTAAASGRPPQWRLAQI